MLHAITFLCETILLVVTAIVLGSEVSQHGGKLTSTLGYLVLSGISTVLGFGLSVCGMHRLRQAAARVVAAFAVRMRARLVSLVSVHPLPVIPVSVTASQLHNGQCLS
jgi:hypothetical protein